MKKSLMIILLLFGFLYISCSKKDVSKTESTIDNEYMSLPDILPYMNKAVYPIYDNRDEKLYPDDFFSIIINHETAKEIMSYDNFPVDVMAYWLASLFRADDNMENVFADNSESSLWHVKKSVYLKAIWEKFYKDNIIQIGLPKRVGISEYEDSTGTPYITSEMWVFVRLKENDIIVEYAFVGGLQKIEGIWKVRYIVDMFGPY